MMNSYFFCFIEYAFFSPAVMISRAVHTSPFLNSQKREQGIEKKNSKKLLRFGAWEHK